MLYERQQLLERTSPAGPVGYVYGFISHTTAHVLLGYTLTTLLEQRTSQFNVKETILKEAGFHKMK